MFNNQKLFYVLCFMFLRIENIVLLKKYFLIIFNYLDLFFGLF